MFEKLEKKLQNIYEQINGKNVIIWGYGESGKFLYERMKNDNKEVLYIIDEGINYVDPLIKRSHILEFCNPKTTMIIITISEELEKVRDSIIQRGFDETNIIDFRSLIYGENRRYNVEYYQYLEYEFGLKILEHKSKEEHGYVGNLDHFNIYGYGKSMYIYNVLKRFEFSENDAIFDFGCGRGGALLLFKYCGIGKIGGIEYDHELYNDAVDNMMILGIDNEILCGDAQECTDILDDYNYFFMNDPFTGEVFSKVIQNIEKSFQRRKRKIVLIYSAARCHLEVVRNNKFQFVKLYDNPGAYITRTTNIYILE